MGLWGHCFAAYRAQLFGGLGGGCTNSRQTMCALRICIAFSTFHNTECARRLHHVAVWFYSCRCRQLQLVLTTRVVPVQPSHQGPQATASTTLMMICGQSRLTYVLLVMAQLLDTTVLRDCMSNVSCFACC